MLVIYEKGEIINIVQVSRIVNQRCHVFLKHHSLNSCIHFVQVYVMQELAKTTCTWTFCTVLDFLHVPCRRLDQNNIVRRLKSLIQIFYTMNSWNVMVYQSRPRELICSFFKFLEKQRTLTVPVRNGVMLPFLFGSSVAHSFCFFVLVHVLR